MAWAGGAQTQHLKREVDMPPWLTPNEVRSDWADAPNDDWLTQYIAAAQVKCVAYAPDLPEGSEIPANYKLALRAQARDLWNALHAKVSAPGAMGLDSYEVQSFPMSWHIQELLRPNTPKPSSLVG
jgi:hypothetical protein